MDVLVFTPVLRLEAETVMGLMALEWEGPLSLLLQRDNPEPTPDPSLKGGERWRNHLHQYQRGRDAFLRGPYDAMLVIESDMIPPADTLKRLAALDCDLAYGCYVLRGGEVVNVLNRYYPWPEQARNIGESLTVHSGLWEAAKRQGIIDCSGSGLGCVLIRRRVLEETPFEAARDECFFDLNWTQEVYSKRYLMRADCQLWCGHIDTNGRVLWPS